MRKIRVFAAWRRSRMLARFALAVAVVSIGLCFAVDRTFAQSSSTLNEIQNVLQGLSNGNSGPTTGSTAIPTPMQPMVLQPATAGGAIPQSRLEQIMSSRAQVNLEQFGYTQLGTGQAITIPQAGAVQDDYILGPGDQLLVTLRGQENDQYTVQIDRNGQIFLPKTSTINVAGRTLADVRGDLQEAVRRGYISTTATVSLAQLRQVSVFVAGEVNSPGMRLVTGLSTPLDAILLSGGIKKTGSLRNVKLIRNGTETTIDLYNVLIQQGGPRSVLLSDGDRILVPSLGRTVAAVGWFRRPGIYELPGGSTSVSVRSLISLAGGLEVRGRYSLSVQRVAPNGSYVMNGLPAGSGTVRDGEILFAAPGANQTEQRAILSGGIPLAGDYSVGKATTLSKLLGAPGALGEHPYTLFGLIIRQDPATKLISLIPFTPVAILQSREDMQLATNDVVRVFTASEAQLLSADLLAYRESVNQAKTNLSNPLDALSQQSGQQTADQLAVDSNGNPLTEAEVERRAVASISPETLGTGGVLSSRLPTNEYPPFGLTSAQRSYLAGAAPPNLAPLVPSVQGPPPSAPASAQSLTDFLAEQSQASANPVTPSTGNSALGATISEMQPSAALPNKSINESAPNLQPQAVGDIDFPSNLEVQTFDQLSRQLHLDPLVLMHFLDGQSIDVSGSVLGAGNYLVGPHARIQDLVAAAGGISNWTDTSHVELISTDVSQNAGTAITRRQIVALTDPAVSQYQLHPRDELRFNEVYSDVGVGSLTLQGQVRYPGTYNIDRGERLSDLLLRAGGLTDVAYPYGTVFLRQSVAAAERDGYRREALEMQNIIASGLSQIGQDKISPDAFTALNAFANQLRNTPALGRMSVVADPVILAANSNRDPLLEPGDVIYIPQRPATVTVLGQVNNPGSYMFKANGTVDDYIDEAGGYNDLSDSSLTFIVFPDGTAQQADDSWLSFNSKKLPPGSTIVVQRDPTPLDFRQVILDASAILQSLAVSAASLAVISSRVN